MADSQGSSNRSRAINWQQDGDKALCKAWLNTSQDPETGTGQKSSTFWKRVHENFLQSYREDYDGRIPPDRPDRANQARWTIIQGACMKFRGAIVKAESVNQSGANQVDIYAHARSLYSATNNKPFYFDHCFTILKDAPKWRLVATDPTLRRSSDIGIATPSRPATPRAASEALVDEGDAGLQRPQGNKAAKRSRLETKNCAMEDNVKASNRLADLAAERFAAQSRHEFELRRNDFYLRLPPDNPDAQAYLKKMHRRYMELSDLEISESSAPNPADESLREEVLGPRSPRQDSHEMEFNVHDNNDTSEMEPGL